MTLYEIEEAITNCVDLETGEIIDEQALAGLQMARDEKVENIALWIKDLKAEAEALKAEKLALAHRQQVAENKAESLKNYLTAYLNGEKFKTAKVAISYRSSKSVNIYDEELIPKDFITYEPKYNKADIKKAIDDGIDISGAEIIEKTSIQIK